MNKHKPTKYNRRRLTEEEILAHVGRLFTLSVRSGGLEGGRASVLYVHVCYLLHPPFLPPSSQVQQSVVYSLDFRTKDESSWIEELGRVGQVT